MFEMTVGRAKEEGSRAAADAACWVTHIQPQYSHGSLLAGQL
jgi:hypothetical protein